MIKMTLIYGIKLYQKFISPKKGYRCAHSVVHGGTGCSGAVIKIIKENSFFSWRNLINKRFADCKQANIQHKKDKKEKNGCKKCLPDFEDGCDLLDGCDGCDFSL